MKEREYGEKEGEKEERVFRGCFMREERIIEGKRDDEREREMRNPVNEEEFLLSLR